MVLDEFLFAEDPGRRYGPEVAEAVGGAEAGGAIPSAVEVEDVFLVPHIFDDPIEAQGPERGLAVAAGDRGTGGGMVEEGVGWETDAVDLVRVGLAIIDLSTGLYAEIALPEGAIVFGIGRCGEGADVVMMEDTRRLLRRLGIGGRERGS